MKERTKLYADMLKGFSLGFLGAVLFRDYAITTNAFFTVAGVACFVGAWVLTGRVDRAN